VTAIPLTDRALPAGESMRAVLRGVRAPLAVLVLFTAVTALMFWPVLAQLHGALLGPPEDNMQDFWNSWYAAVARDPSHVFSTTLLRFPEGTPLIYQSFAYPQLAAVAALAQIFGSDLHTLVALQNLTLLASFPLAGLGAFLFVRHLSGSTAGGLIGGFVFAFNPSHIAQAMHHAHVSQIEFLPFFAFAWLLTLERRSIAWLAAAIVLMALSALSCWYYLFYCAYFIALHLLYLRVRDGAWPRGWHLLAPVLCVAGAVLLLAPLLVPMVLQAGPQLYDPGSNTYVADLAGYVAFPPAHAFAVVAAPLTARFTGYPWEATVYLGLVNLAVLVALCWHKGLRPASPAFQIVFGMIAFALLASGEALHVAGHATALHLPDVALDKLPFFANVRTPARAIVFVYLYLAAGIGMAAAALLQRPAVLRRALAAVTAVLIVADFWPVHLATTPVTCAPGLSVLRRDTTHGFGILNLPFAYVEENAYMLEQACDGRPMVDGNTSREMARTLVYRLPLADPGRLRVALAQAHVKYVLVHHPRGGLFAWPAALPQMTQLRRAFTPVYDGPDMTVLRVYPAGGGV
jgi:hypothetical protein